MVGKCRQPIGIERDHGHARDDQRAAHVAEVRHLDEAHRSAAEIPAGQWLTANDGARLSVLAECDAGAREPQSNDTETE